MKPVISPPLVNFSPDDIEEFAAWLGFEGSDADTFYEAYYDIEHYDDIEVELEELGYDP